VPNSNSLQLLRILADGRFHSGERLGGALGVSRSGVWKNLRRLRADGVEIHSVRGKGYRLAGPIELLDAEAIRAAVAETSRPLVPRIETHYELDSTNSEWLRRAAELPAGAVCLAEVQRAGRGRLNRRWVAPCGSGLCLSMLWRFSRGPDALIGLGLVVGLAVLRALDQMNVPDAGLKWPNDIVCRGAKLAGSLIELSGESGGNACAVVGVGINVTMPRAAGRTIDQPWIDLSGLCGKVSRNRLAGGVIHHLVQALARFDDKGLGAFIEEWRSRDALAGRPVSIRTMAGEDQGVARGIDASGALLVEAGGEVRRYFAGDVSVRTMNRSGMART
jgi:BirA family biotin operon repressor/biotin-[acetyl-CoA-carboxylase] ligase